MSSLETIIKSARNIAAGIALSAVSILSANAQYNVHVKAASLDKTPSGTPIAGAVISKDQGDVVKVSDANGDAVLTNVGGSMSIKASHPDYKQFEQTFNISSDTTIYFAMPKTIRLGPWGTDNLNADWWKYIYSCSATQDPLHWKQIIPVNVRIEGASVADSLNIVAAMDMMKNSSGYDLFKIVSPTASKDTTYTIYMNTGPNTSTLIPDINLIAYKGWSKITGADITLITHEIVKSQYGWPTGLIPRPLTNAEPSTPDRPPWQPLDGSYLSLKLEQDFRKKGGKQSLMIFNMQNYVALGNVGVVPIVFPANNAVDVDTLLSILGTKDVNTTSGYDFKITSDALGNNIVISQNGVDRPRISNVDLEPGKDYYIWERANGNNVGSWGTPNKISTKSLLTTYKREILLGSGTTVYPNPTSKDITVKYYLLQGSIINISLYNYTGKKLTCDSFAESTGLQSHRIDLTYFGKGIYILKLVTCDSGQERLIKTFKLIKE
jgi:hypothetical protein